MPASKDWFDPRTDLAAMLSLRAAVWGADHLHCSAAFQRWLYGDAAETPCGILVRQPDGEPAGFAGVCVKRCRLNGADATLAHGLDYMIRPSMNNLMAGRTAVRVAREWIALAREMGCVFGLVFPNDHSNRILTSKHVGFASAFQPALLVRPLSTALLKERVRAHVSRRATTGALWLAALNSQLISGFAAPANGGAGEPVAAFGPEFDALWELAAPELGFAMVRDAQYLSWRYHDHPVYDYTCLAWRTEGRLDGFAITSPRRLEGVNALLLVDLLASSWGAPGWVAERLVRASIEHARADHRDVVAALAVPGSKVYRALRRCGFYRLPRWLVSRPFNALGIALANAGAAAAVNPTDWHFTWGDTDVV